MIKSRHQSPWRAGLALAAGAWAPLAVLITSTMSQALGDPLAQAPLYLAERVSPRMMLLLSKDDLMFTKAYTDWSDIKPAAIDDESLDTTYNDQIDYYGYFDYNRCYTYSSTNGYFEPDTAATGTNSHQCSNSGQWSGNFLNWATMTRMDIVRKVLYGGYRSTDTSSSGSTTGKTVLERSLLPTDSHAFVKVFNPGSAGTVALYTPFSPNSGAISICNVSYTTSGNSSDIDAGNDTPTSPAPRLRVASGAWPQWATSEVRECFWTDDSNSSTQPTRSGLTSDGSALPTAINARVQVCVPGKLESNCKAYPNGGNPNEKPTGILQEYGESGGIYFSLMTGSYADNISGGVLRKSMGPLAGDTTNALNNEIDADTGLFINQDSSDAGIINTINRLRIAKFDFSDFGTGARYSDGCSLGTLSFSDGTCSDWGNPLGEMYLEALRYYAGATSPTSGFNANDASYIQSLPEGDSVTGNLWSVDPVPDTQWCAKSNVLVLSTGLSAFDTDELSYTDPLTDLDIAGETNTIGDEEDISTHSFFIGQNGTLTDGRCTAKTLAHLADAKGICPEVPFQQGGYQIAGLAYYAHTNSLRATNTTRKGPLMLNTYAVQLADSIPKYSIPVGNSTVNLIPACEANPDGTPHDGNAVTDMSDDTWHACNFVNLAPEAAAKDSSGNDIAGTGSFLVTWDDNPWGSDHDMDDVERILYCVGTACGSIESSDPIYGPLRDTNVAAGQIKVAVWSVQVAAGYAHLLEYVISGTTEDTTWNPRKYGVVRKGGDNFSCFTSSPPASYCAPTTIPTSGSNNPGDPPYAYAHVYTASSGTSAAGLLQNPLWYAAKWGGFAAAPDPNNPNETLPLTNLPLDTSQWDADNDAVPDNFFAVKNMSQLPAVMDSIFGKVQGAQSSSSSVVANSVALNAGSRLYQARFNSGGWTGELWSYVLNTDGTVGNVEWDAACALSQNSSCLIDDSTHGTHYSVTPAAQTTRQILTYKPSTASGVSPTGVPFEWNSLADSQQILLNTNPDSGTTDTNGQDRLNYLRGDTSQEARNGGTFRDRTVPRGESPVTMVPDILGDIVDSSPVYVGPPGFSYPDSWGTGAPENAHHYSDFRSDHASRESMVYAGANDGMLHGFTAAAGVEKIAYIPNAVMAGLSSLSSLNYTHQYYVDGPPTAGDAFFDGAWHTVLVGGLRAGGKAIYALDITDPSAFSENDAADLVLWEFSNVNTSGSDTDTTHWDPNLGYSFSQPAIVRMANGQWAAVFGNGYHNADAPVPGGGMAYLYVVDIGTGSIIKRFGPLTDATENGLSTPAPVDIDGDNIVDYIYAGDLQGNVWKFDVTGEEDVQWHVAFNGSPLYTAKDGSTSHNRQPITSRPEVGASPTGEGLLIYFGTGKYYETTDSDISNAPTQTFYAIWDKNDGTTPSFTRSDLQEQTVVATTTQNGYNLRVTSDNPVTWRTGTDTTGKVGWYIDLPTTGERQVSDSILRGGSIIFTTLTPSQQPCDFGGSSWLMELDASSGSRPLTSPFDVDNDSGFTQADFVTVTQDGESSTVPATGIAPPNPGIFWTPLIVSQTTGIQQFKFMSESTSAIWNITENPGSAGRQSWRQIQ